MADFKKGDVVYLNSNPDMKFTVHAVLSTGLNSGKIEVVYFNEKNNHFEYPKFDPELLTLVNESK